MRFRHVGAALVLGLTPLASLAQGASSSWPRPPAVPLIACDPYLSIWSCGDRLTDAATRHWTGSAHTLAGMIRVDGRAYRFMGADPSGVAALAQTGLRVSATHSDYTFAGSGVQLRLSFFTAALPDNLDALSRPVGYLTTTVRATDGRRHTVSILLGVGADLAVHTLEQRVEWGRTTAAGRAALRVGSVDQPVLERAGDGTRIDWGHAYLAPLGEPGALAIAGADACLTGFALDGTLPADDQRMPRAVRDEMPMLAAVLTLGDVGADGVTRTTLVAYDDVASILYFGRPLVGYWRRRGMTAEALLGAAMQDFARLDARGREFDAQLEADAAAAGGPKYAGLCALAYRQCIAGCKLAADSRGMPMLFAKENTSNGCIATVDVIFPMDPMFLLISPALARASLAPVLAYTASPLWKFRYAPHDLGTYPRATRQVYGADDPAHEGDRMPVEESGNMILLLAAIAQVEGSPAFASQYWPQVTLWAKYLEEKGFDPANQLCTDDFTGHLAHNANLSVKAILALGAYGRLCGMRGDRVAEDRYLALARTMAKEWVRAAEDGGHSRIAFDRPGTWSMKYNLVWDQALGLGVFDPSVARRDLAWYRSVADRYGAPLDHRQPYAKADWSIWTASMSETMDGFRALADPVAEFVNDTPSRNPITDLYWTKTSVEVGMHARPVIGGVFMRMLMDRDLWKRWASRGASAPGRWAPIPTPRRQRVLVPTSEGAGLDWRFTFDQPTDGWEAPGFADGAWRSGPGPMGAPGTPGVSPRSTWSTPDVWMRRTVTLAVAPPAEVYLSIYHDEDAEVYINGVLAARVSGYVAAYTQMRIRPEARKALRKGPNVLAVHCRQTEGGQGIDVGLVQLLGR